MREPASVDYVLHRSAVTVLTHSEAISEVSKSEWQGEEIQ